jgi:hypothetical protein
LTQYDRDATAYLCSSGAGTGPREREAHGLLVPAPLGGRVSPRQSKRPHIGLVGASLQLRRSSISKGRRLPSGKSPTVQEPPHRKARGCPRTALYSTVKLPASSLTDRSRSAACMSPSSDREPERLRREAPRHPRTRYNAIGHFPAPQSADRDELSARRIDPSVPQSVIAREG